MRKQFFGVILEAQEKYSFPTREEVIFQQVCLITGKSEDTNIKIFGEANGTHLLLASVAKNASVSVKITLSEEGISNLFAHGTGSVDLVGYTTLFQEEVEREPSPQKKIIQNPHGDAFNALQEKVVVDDGGDDHIDVSKMSKKQRKRFLKNQAIRRQMEKENQ